MTATRFTGVTLQTLHEKSFDHGTILAQTPKNGLAIPFPYQCTHKDLLEFITPKAAEMLVQGIKDRVFVPPLKDVGWYHSTNIHHATKITSQDRQIDWKSWPSLKVERYHRAIGRLWNNIQFEPNTVKRVIFEDIEVVEMPEVLVEWSVKAREYSEGKIEEENDFKAVRFMVYLSPNNDRIPQFYVADGDAIIIAAPGPSSDLASSQAVRVKEITVDGQGKQAASKIMTRIHDRKMWQLMKRGSTSFWVKPEQPRTRKI
jgi:methionyl-tRNA formyltransferase